MIAAAFAMMATSATSASWQASAQPVIRLGGASGGFGTADAPHTRPSLISRTDAAQRGGAVEFALRLQLDPEWHVYWVNPGDAGLPPKLRWTLPEGVAVSEIDWPVPRYQKDDHGLVTYLYEGDVVLPLTLTLDNGFAGDRVEVVADATWLVCREACLPGRARLTLDLPVVDSTPVEAEANAGLFAAADARRPVSGGTDTVRRVDDPPGRFSLDIHASHLGVLGGGEVAARIMPVDPGLVDESARHPASWSVDGILRITAPRADAAAAPPNARGFVELRRGEHTQLFRFGPQPADPSH